MILILHILWEVGSLEMSGVKQEYEGKLSKQNLYLTEKKFDIPMFSSSCYKNTPKVYVHCGMALYGCETWTLVEQKREGRDPSHLRYDVTDIL